MRSALLFGRGDAQPRSYLWVGNEVQEGQLADNAVALWLVYKLKG